MNVITDFDYFKINLKTLEEEMHLELDGIGPCDEIRKYKNGYLINGEDGLSYIESDLVWEYNSNGIVENVTVNDDLIKVHQDYPYRTFTLNSDGKEV